MKIDLNLDFLKYLKNENSIKTVKISIKKNKINKITDFLNYYKFNLPRLIIYNQIEDGFIQANVDVNFYGNSQKTNIIRNVFYLFR